MSFNNQADSFPGRVFYHAGGGVRVGRFILWLLPAIAGSALLALMLFWLFRSGHYYLVIAPAVASLAVGALVRMAVTKGHCRNWVVGGLAGLCAAVVLYLGYFYCGMVYHWGPRVVGRPDLLPVYVKARMKTDQVREVGSPRESLRRDSRMKMNWFNFTFEAGIALVIVIFPGIQRSRRPYCEACGSWTVRQVTSFAPSTSAAVLDALRTGSSQTLAELCAKPLYSSVPNLTLGVDVCPSRQDGGLRGCSVYISVKQVRQSPGVAGADPIDHAKGKRLLRPLQATPGEIIALAPRFKLLDGFVGRLAAAGSLQATTGGAAQTLLPVKIEAVESEYAGKVLTRGMLWGGTALAFVPLLFFFGGLGLAAWARTFQHEAVSSSQELTALGLMGVGMICTVAGAFVALRHPAYIANKIVERRLRRNVALRPKRIVNPGDPRGLFVEIVPKANWGRLMLDTASDVGLLLLDEAKGELLYEGDRERFRIPAGTLTHCGLEEFVHQQGNTQTAYYYIVLRIENTTQFWEAPIRLRSGGGARNRERKKEMTSLFNRVQQVGPARAAVTD